MQTPITTTMHNGKESKEFIMPTSWQNFKDNSHFCLTHKTFCIQTGKRSNITVVNFDDKAVYEDLISKCPDLKSIFSVSTNQEYYLYFKYNPLFKTKTNIIKGDDIRNGGGCVIAPSTKYILSNGKTTKYKFVISDILEMSKTTNISLIMRGQHYPRTLLLSAFAMQENSTQTSSWLYTQLTHPVHRTDYSLQGSSKLAQASRNILAAPVWTEKKVENPQYVSTYAFADTTSTGNTTVIDAWDPIKQTVISLAAYSIDTLDLEQYDAMWWCDTKDNMRIYLKAIKRYLVERRYLSHTEQKTGARTSSHSKFT